MKFKPTLGILLAAALLLSACSNSPDDNNQSPDDSTEGNMSLERMFPTDENPKSEFENCTFSSPIKWVEEGQTRILAMDGSGTLSALDPMSGEVVWDYTLPAPEGEKPLAFSQPVMLEGDRMVVTYMTTPADHGGAHDANAPRLSHRVAVVDLAERALANGFDTVVLEAEIDGNGGPVPFRPGHYLSRPDLAHAIEPGQELGNVYITGGNTRDIQPWHGWAFEVSLDAWRDEGAENAVTGVMVTTPEPDENCGPEGSSGSRERKCGGGLWAPSGPLVVQENEGYHLILAPGNGQLDLDRDDYANTLMKVEPGLEFDPMCDPQACADFDPDQPSDACIQSCQNLWIPRILEGQQPPDPADGRCDGLTLFECWQNLDYIGGSTPVRVDYEGTPLLIYPTKDGHAYLVNNDHLGTMHDRHKMVETCGTEDDPCRHSWAGMSVTQPLVADTADGQTIMIPTFMPDQTHPAGIVAVGLTGGGEDPKLERLWEFPSFDTEDAVNRFRAHPSRMSLSPDGEWAWVVESHQNGGETARLIALEVETGEAVFDKKMNGSGNRYTVPLIDDDRIYVPTCDSDGGPSYIEGYQLVEKEE
jgi:hypothetical protein